MTDQIAEIVASLPTMDRVTGLWEVIDRRLGDGDAAFLADLGIALHARYDAQAAKVWQYRSVADRLLRLLALTPGDAHVGQALRLFTRTGGRVQARYVASLLSAGQDPRALAALFGGGVTGGGVAEELRACLVHEWVLRGVTIAETPAAAWAVSGHWRHHPLGWLPLSLSELEADADLPGHGVPGRHQGTPFFPLDEQSQATGGPVPHATETTETTDDMAAAVLNWVDESNGSIEARTFDLTRPLDNTQVASLLAALGLECLSGLGGRARLTVWSCPPERAWRLLFAAASSGGAYNSGLYGAYGRLAAWRSLAGLTSCAGASATDVERAVRAHTWHTFEATTEWFQQVAWDIGLAGLAPDRRRMSVLAATDTD